jgi:hypothetical protein
LCIFNVNFTLPHWHDPFHVSTGSLDSDVEVMMGKAGREKLGDEQECWKFEQLNEELVWD